MSDPEALICAYRLDGKGGGQPLQWSAVMAPALGELTWIHLHREAKETRAWLFGQSGIPHVVCEALIADDSRPRCTSFSEGVLLDLRGVNLNPGAVPEDMVSIRLWFERDRIVSVRRRKLLAINDIRANLEHGTGPVDTGSFLVAVADRLVTRMAGVIGAIDDRVDELEDAVLTAESYELRRDLRELRRQAIALRRYIGPNREAMAWLSRESVSWFDQVHQQHLREVSDRITRYIEDLDTARERAAVVQDELASRLSESMNRNTYVLSVIAGIFLPLSLITGLLGINVAGIPGEKWKWAFTAVCGILVLLAVVEFVFLRRLRWFRSLSGGSDGSEK